MPGHLTELSIPSPGRNSRWEILRPGITKYLRCGRIVVPPYGVAHRLGEGKPLTGSQTKTVMLHRISGNVAPVEIAVQQIVPVSRDIQAVQSLRRQIPKRNIL